MPAELFGDRMDIRGLAGMIELVAAHGFGSSATPHVEAMNGVAGFERGVGKAYGVTGFAGAFQAVDEEEFGSRVALGALRVHQNLHSRLRVVQVGFDWEAVPVGGPLPEVRRYGQEVRVLK